MKKILFIALLMPVGLMAQKDSTINFSQSLKFHVADDYGFKSDSNNIPMTLKVFENAGKLTGPNGRLLMETDTAGNIHVYGDTLSVLKAIINSYHIKIKQ